MTDSVRPMKRSGTVSRPPPSYVPENVSGKDMSAAGARLPSLDFSNPRPVERQEIDPGRIVVSVLIELLDDSPYQPRIQYDETKLTELGDSLRVRQIDPLCVRYKDGGRFELIGGHRRKRAAALAGIESLDCIVINVSDDEAQVLVLAANEGHEEFCDFERALAYQAVLEAGKKTPGGIRTQRQLAERIGRDEGLVSRVLTMLKLPEHVQNVLRARPDAFSSHYSKKILKLTETVHDEAKLVKELYRVAAGEMQISALFGVMAGSSSTPSARSLGLSLQRGNKVFAQVTPNTTKREVTVKLPGDCDVEEVASLILAAIDQRFALKSET